jgi:4-hydroxy-4-methyl-2-oxoglutarate aldolase
VDKYAINTTFERPDPDLVRRASAIILPVIGMRVGPRQIVDPDIKPLVPEWSICGPAFTVRPEVEDDRLIAQLAPKYAEPGDVIVVDAGGKRDRAVWGSGMTTGAQRAGVGGVVVDGMLESSHRIVDELGIPVFSRGVYSHVPGAAESPGWMNFPVIIGGVIVYPGDIVVGRQDGIVVIPRLWAEDVVRACEERVAWLAERRSVERPPYWEIYGSEEKLRALPGIRWSGSS